MPKSCEHLSRVKYTRFLLWKFRGFTLNSVKITVVSTDSPGLESQMFTPPPPISDTRVISIIGSNINKWSFVACSYGHVCFKCWYVIGSKKVKDLRITNGCCLNIEADNTQDHLYLCHACTNVKVICDLHKWPSIKYYQK